MTTHTLGLQYKVFERPSVQSVIVDDDGYTVALVESNKAVAYAIVRACNSHDAMLEALKAGMKTLEKIGHADGFHAYEQMRQAKAQAEGKVQA